ncbi:hypothetical protein H310_10766 [Aphanomyces invadans]|uniref:Uncharacterized protein n=1 Tax=Aphanomyces invadans TaxID=157072 RepID=A0A024TQ20_9STRA|nr:hypothetical protein H310_10766 [Aphanomyces invadans]ETV96133.1 hypothetical protein H310_10766 [Aphanomyces invadans]|eukprot:XP_008875444.1 hypothetical protein H310_10766 [Aphanomyces invadans]
MAAITQGSRGRRQTVNERIDSILDDFCRSSIVHPGAETDVQAVESKRLSQLYQVSLDDQFLKDRVHHLPSPVSRERQTAISRHMYSRERAALPPAASPLAVTKPTAPHNALPICSPIKASQSTSKLHQLQKLQPWYMGHNNVGTGPACTLHAKTKRYGARGAVQLSAAETVAGTVPTMHPTKLHPSPSLESGLANLAKFQHPNTWSPTLRGSPTMWSEEAAFVYGASLSFHNTRQPHVHPASKVKVQLRDVDPDALRVNEKTKAELKALESALLQEQQAERAKCAATRDVLDDVREQQRVELSKHVHHAKVPAKAMKEMTLIKTAGPARVAAISTKLMQCKYDLRWRTMFVLIDAMRRSVFNRPLLQELSLLLERIAEQGTRQKRANPFELSRDQCRELFAKEYPAFGESNVNLMYSSFDPTHTDCLDMRDVISTVKALRMSNANTRASSMKDVVMELLAMYAAASTVYVFHVLRVLCLFCTSTDDEDALVHRVETLFQLYRPFRHLHGRVDLDAVDAFLTEQSAIVDVFTDNLMARRRHIHTQTLHNSAE